MSTKVSVPRPTPLWFGDTLARVHVSGEESEGRLAIVESLAPAGDMPPLHLHRREDEVFHVLEGRLTLHLPGEHVELAPGETFRAPRGIPHTYRVESATARWLVVCAPAGFDALVRETGDPAPADELPPRGRPHDAAALAAAAARHGIEVLGPPGALPE
jgi:quercetin dioxygenase-like cupin family protein